ncbi:MAG TPA: hypothetical protein PLI95_14655 [Polyangiaceae bacterium]|nr:hypothetical protein [Polyangiaceae bacterium]
MTARSFFGLAVAIATTCGVGCSSDLFHETEWPTLCDLEPDAPECVQGEAGTGDEDSGAGGGGASDAALDSPMDSATSDATDANDPE